MFAISISIPIRLAGNSPYVHTWDQLAQRWGWILGHILNHILFASLTGKCFFSLEFYPLFLQDKNKTVFSPFLLRVSFYLPSLFSSERVKGFSLHSWTLKESLTVDLCDWCCIQTWWLLCTRFSISERFKGLCLLNMKRVLTFISTLLRHC